jgi:putative inorganic carbon (hco3(-)) transporter
VAFWFFYLYLFLYLFRPYEFNAELTAFFTTVPLMPMSLALAAISCLFEKMPKNLALPIWLTPILLFVMGISTMLTGWAGGFIEIFSLYWILPVQLFVASFAVKNEEQLRSLFKLFCMLAVLMSINGIQQADSGIGFSGVTILDQGDGLKRIRYSGVLSDPNDLGLYFLVTLPMSFFLFTTSKNILTKFLVLTGVAIVFVGIYLTNSRGTLVGFSGVLGLVMLLRRNFVGIILGVITLFAALLLGPSRVAEIDISEESAWQRVEAWYEGINLFLSKPIFGVGLDGFVDAFRMRAHNSYVQVFSEYGIIGYTLWLCLIYTCIRITFRPKIVKNPGEKIDVAGTVFLSFVAFLFAGFFLTRSFESMFFILIGLSCSIHHFMPHLSVYHKLPAGKSLAHSGGFALASIMGFMILSKALHLIR